MEVLIHPRVLPLSDFLPVRLSSPEPQATYKIYEDMYSDDMNSSKLLKINTQGMGQSAPDLDDDLDNTFLHDEVADDTKEAPIRDAGNEINDDEMTYNTTNEAEKEPSSNGLSSVGMAKTIELATTAIIDKDCVFADASMNSSPISSKYDKSEDLERDDDSNLLPEDDFPDIIDADPDTDYEVWRKRYRQS